MWLDRFFARAELPAGLEDQLRALAHEGTLVFVMSSAGWLNLSNSASVESLRTSQKWIQPRAK